MWALSALDLDLVGALTLTQPPGGFWGAEGTIALLFRTRTPDRNYIAKQEVIRLSAARVFMVEVNNVSVQSKENKNLPQSIHNVKHLFDSSLLNA
jgi:hypothetical protein